MSLSRHQPPSDALGLASLADLRSAGWTRAAERTALKRGQFAREGTGILRVQDVNVSTPSAAASLAENAVAARDREQDALRQAAAAARRCDRAVLNHAPAAVVHEIPLLNYAVRPCLTVPAGTALRDLSGIHLHRAGLPGWQRTSWDRFTLATPARVCVDLAREFGIDAGVVAMDAALRTGLTSADELDAVLLSCTRWPGKRLARAAFELADGCAESPLESLSRLGFVRGGLSDFVPQAVILDQWGRFVARLDFLWPRLGVAGEADGLGKYELGPDSLLRQRLREGAATQLGLEFVRWGWADLADFRKVITAVGSAAQRVRRQARPQLWHLG